MIGGKAAAPAPAPALRQPQRTGLLPGGFALGLSPAPCYPGGGVAGSRFCERCLGDRLVGDPALATTGFDVVAARRPQAWGWLATFGLTAATDFLPSLEPPRSAHWEPRRRRRRQRWTTGTGAVGPPGASIGVTVSAVRGAQPGPRRASLVAKRQSAAPAATAEHTHPSPKATRPSAPMVHRLDCARPPWETTGGGDSGKVSGIARTGGGMVAVSALALPQGRPAR